MLRELPHACVGSVQSPCLHACHLSAAACEPLKAAHWNACAPPLCLPAAGPAVLQGLLPHVSEGWLGAGRIRPTRVCIPARNPAAPMAAAAAQRNAGHMTAAGAAIMQQQDPICA